METPESIRTSLTLGEWVSSIDLWHAYLHTPIHPNSRKYLRFCHRSQVFQFTHLPFGLATAPQVFTMIVKEVKLMALSRGLRLHQYLDDWPIRSQSQEETQVITQAVVDLIQSLGWIINQEKSELKPTQVFFIRGLQIPSRFSPCKTHSREMAQTSGFDPKTPVKTCFDCKMFDVANWVACLNGENGPGGMPSHEALSVSSQGALEISSVARQHPSLDRSHCSTLRLVAKSPKHDERCRPSSQRPQYPTLYRRLKQRLGRSLRLKFYKGSVVRLGKKATHKPPRIEGGLPGPSKLQGPVPEPNSAICNGQLDSGSLHKQTRRNSLSRDVCSPVEDHDLVPSLSHNIESQTHSRVPECDGRHSVQVEPSAVNRMVTASAGIQTDLPKVVHTSCGLICHSSEPQTSISGPRPKCLGHRCSEHKLDGSHCLCLPSDGSPSQGDPKNQAMLLPDHHNSPRLARDALVLGPSAALNKDPSTTSSVNDSSQIVPQLCVPQQSTASQPPRLVSRSGQLQEQGFSVEVAERIAAPQRSSTRTIYKSSGPYLRNSAEKIRWISPLHL